QHFCMQENMILPPSAQPEPLLAVPGSFTCHPPFSKKVIPMATNANSICTDIRGNHFLHALPWCFSEINWDGF
ncbi:hypothetical protein GOODEAATRI_020197, partial [Goodea atripinnis]